jgi:hypothetical protein
LASCRFPSLGLPEQMPITDPRISPLLEAAKKIDRSVLGFKPIPNSGNVRVEWAQGKGPYDVMLHMDYHAFRRTPSGYEWIWEQEQFIGPKEWESADGLEHEQIDITFQTVNISGVPLNKVVIQYTGNDSRLLKSPSDFMNFDLTLAEVAPIIKEWSVGSSVSK